MSDSAASASTRLARQAILVAFAVCLGGIVVLAGERFILGSQIISAAEHLNGVTAITGEVLLDDEKATQAMRMAIITRDPKWLSRYEEALEELDRDLAAAEVLAGNVSKPYVERARAANTRLVELERRALELMKRGHSLSARLALEAEAYDSHKQNLVDSMLALRAQLVGEAEQRWERLKKLSQWLAVAMVALVTASLMLVWWRLNAALTTSEKAYHVAEADLRWMARHDLLTGVANRWYFTEQKRSTLEALRGEEKCAVFALDLDRFKPVNELYGHRIGDEVLKVVAKRLSSTAKNALVARVGGDEFGILVRNVSSEEELRRLAEWILTEVQQPVQLANLWIKIGISIGYTICEAHSGHLSELEIQDGSAVEATLRRADMALHEAKLQGRGCYRRFEASMEAALFERVELEAEIGDAIRDGQVVPHYQPIVDMRSGKVISIEALARWNHPKKGLLHPSEIIPVAENTGMIGSLTHELLRRALEDARNWPDDVNLSINLSPLQLADSWLATRLMATIGDGSFPPRRLELEITENALIENMQTARGILESFKRLGVRVALDDFGSGYAGLRYLREFTFDRLKIDRGFVRNITRERRDTRIVAAILQLSRSLNLEVVAEGVEDRATRDCLLELGCSLGQGYLFSKPVPAEEIRRLVNRVGVGLSA